MEWVLDPRKTCSNIDNEVVKGAWYSIDQWQIAVLLGNQGSHYCCIFGGDAISVLGSIVVEYG